MNDLKTYKNLINYEWVPVANLHVIHNPATAEPIAIVPESSSDDVNRAVLAARHAFDKGSCREADRMVLGQCCSNLQCLL